MCHLNFELDSADSRLILHWWKHLRDISKKLCEKMMAQFRKSRAASNFGLQNWLFWTVHAVTQQNYSRGAMWLKRLYKSDDHCVLLTKQFKETETMAFPRIPVLGDITNKSSDSLAITIANKNTEPAKTERGIIGNETTEERVEKGPPKYVFEIQVRSLSTTKSTNLRSVAYPVELRRLPKGCREKN